MQTIERDDEYTADGFCVHTHKYVDDDTLVIIHVLRHKNMATHTNCMQFIFLLWRTRTCIRASLH